MNGKILRVALASFFSLGLALPGAVLAGDNRKGCNIAGTWYGVNDLDDKMPTRRPFSAISA